MQVETHRDRHRRYQRLCLQSKESWDHMRRQTRLIRVSKMFFLLAARVSVRIPPPLTLSSSAPVRADSQSESSHPWSGSETGLPLLMYTLSINPCFSSQNEDIAPQSKITSTRIVSRFP